MIQGGQHGGKNDFEYLKSVILEAASDHLTKILLEDSFFLKQLSTFVVYKVALEIQLGKYLLVIYDITYKVSEWLHLWYLSCWKVNQENIPLNFLNKAPFDCLEVIEGVQRLQELQGSLAFISWTFYP